MTSSARRMLVFAAGCSEQAQAPAAEAAVRRMLDIGRGDLSVGEIAGSEEFVDGASVMLAGRIREFRMDEASQIIRSFGGVILTNVPERSTTLALGPATRA